MDTLASRDSYIQKLTSKVCGQRHEEPRNRPFVYFKGKDDSGPPKKKKKKKNKSKQKQLTQQGSNEKTPPPKPQQKPPSTPAAVKGSAAAKLNVSKPKAATADGTQTLKGASADVKFSTVDVLRKRLHEKIEESRGQGAPKDASSEAVQAKRAKRKLERERKKRKRKEFLMKKLAEKAGLEPPVEIKQEEEPAPAPAKRDETAIIFNTVETVEDGYVDKMERKKNKKKSTKGKLTPLTGKNYKQLLSRVEARKAKLEDLREKDEGKALELEQKMRWTNVLYKAEGLRIKDDEDMLRSALKRKEKTREQRKRRWDERSENVVEKMQRRQDKRRRNIQKQSKGKMDRKKDKLRKRGRVLPEDLKKAKV